MNEQKYPEGLQDHVLEIPSQLPVIVNGANTDLG